MDPKIQIEFLRGNLDITTLPENERKDLLSSVREDYSKNQTELVTKTAEIEKLTEQVDSLNQSVDTLTAEKEELDKQLRTYEELDAQRLAERKEQLLSEIEEEMTLLGRPMDEDSKDKYSKFDISYLEVFSTFLKNTPVDLNELNQDPPKGDGSIGEGLESDPNEVYDKDKDGSKKPVKTLYSAERFGKSEYR